MTIISSIPTRERDFTTVMETIMKPIANAARAPRWLMAAGMALSATLMPLAGINPAYAQDPERLQIRPDGPYIDLSPADQLEVAPPSGHLTPFLTKTGIQLGCDYAGYRLKLGVTGSPAMIGDPDLDELFADVRFDLEDQLPAGLEIVDVKVEGDITGPGGSPAPAHVISTTATADDTLSLSDFRLSADDLDGDGSLTERRIWFTIKARIDHAAFPAPTLVDNQAIAILTYVGDGLGVGPQEMPSRDPALPDDGNWKTGEATTIAIDVTDCEPPPPPPGGEEPCFEIDTGEIDCVAGGGAYIYSMHVGPEMAGNVVTVTPLEPGIVIDPPSQVVPAGGGTLEWEITGALPGDVIHLTVTGVETYAGPAEGVGLCCSQQVVIEIPEDLECPPVDEDEPDIRIDKRADEAECEPEGPCDFTIRATNVGDGPYTGKIVLDEVTAPGNAAVVAGPNAPWTCLPMASPMSCEHPEVTLDPGEFVELKLGFQPGAAWPGNVIRNCAEYDYTASGKGPFGDPTNDKACASIRICHADDPECNPPGDDSEPDIGVRKMAEPIMCSPDGLCRFVITVYNGGLSNIDAPVTFIDEFPLGDVASANFNPTPPWSCAPLSGNTFQCDHPGLNLPVGASTNIEVWAAVEDYPSAEVENCAEVQPLDGETNLTNNKACAKARIPGGPQGEPVMRIEKSCEPMAAFAAPSCRITVTNVGTAAPVGPVRVNDAAEIIGSGTPVTITGVSPDGLGWSCGAVPADTLSCEIAGAVMTPGTSRYFDVRIDVAPNERFENCARGSFGPAPGDDIVYPFGEACAQGGTELTIEKSGDAQCLIGEPCTFEITITKEGPNDSADPVRIGDALRIEGFGGVPATILSVEPPFGCTPEPTALPFACETDLGLGAGESRVYEVTVEISGEGGVADAVGNGAEGRNCVAVLGPHDDAAAAPNLTLAPAEAEGERAYDCHEFAVLPQEDETPQCSPGFVLNTDGRCVCPEGTAFRNGQCVGESVDIPRPTPRPDPVSPPPPPPPPPPEVKQCRLLPGQIRTSDGRCVCPRGTRLERGRCVRPTPPPPPPPELCRLLPGQIRTSDGRCVCPRGTRLVRNRCVEIAPPQCKLLPGQIRTNDGRCVCPRGTRLERGRCVKPTPPPPPQCKLLPGQIRTKDGRCICPRGTQLVRGRCAKVQQPPSLTTPPREPKPTLRIVPDVLRQLRPRNDGTQIK